MNKAIGAALLGVGILLLIFGLNASDSAGSQISRLFTGTPTDKSMWLMIGGAAAITIGAITTFRNSGKA